MADQSFDGWTDSKALTANGFTGADGASFQSWNTQGGGDVNARKIIRAGIVACGDGGPPQQICSGSVI